MSFGVVKQNIVILAISNMIIGLIEFLFNIYLSRILGAEGLGLLSLVSPINCLFLSFMTEGVVITISKTSSRLQHFNDYSSMNSTILITTIASFLWSLILVFLLFLSAGPIAKYFLLDESLVYPILSTAPLMILMSISNIIKGHFLGLSKIKVPAIINIAEKILRFPLLYLLIRFVLNKFNFPPVTIVYLCYSLGEIQSVLLLELYYKVTKPRVSMPKITIKLVMETLGPIVKGAVPICLTQCLFEVVNAFSSVIVKARLCSIGLSTYEALSLLGKYRGMVFPLLCYPMILVGAACAIVVPKLATMVATNKSKYANRLIKRSIILSLAVGMVTCIIFWFSASWMGNVFYHRDDLTLMIRLAGICSPLLYVTVTTSNLLIGLGEESQSFRNSLLQQLLLLIGLVLFTGIPSLNIYGYYVAVAISQTYLSIKNIICIFRHKSNYISS